MRKMTAAHEMVALLEARGCTNVEIADATGYNANYIARIKREFDGYKSLVIDFKREIQERTLDEAVSIEQRFNSRVGIMADNLEELALRAGKEGVRLKATQDWLDRAPDAPKRVAKSEITEDRTITFTMTQMDNIKQALVDVGQGEVMDLIEDADYEVLAAQPEKAGVAVNVDDI